MATVSLPNDLSDEFLLHALMESTADSIYFKDRECRLLRVSRKMEKDLGCSDPAELVGKTDIDLFGEAFGQGTRSDDIRICLLYTSPSPRDGLLSRMPSSA